MTGTPYRYRAFGVEIASAIPLPGLPKSAGVPDVFITVGDLPAGSGDTAGDARLRHAAQGEILCRSPIRGSYSVRRGREIILTPEFVDSSAEPEQRCGLLEFVFVFLWLQRGSLCLHAGGVSINGRAILFIGDCGSGKSTLSAALACRGHDKLADDLSPIVFGPDGVTRVVPFCTHQNLTSDALAMIGLDSRESEKLPREDKYSLAYLSTSTTSVPLVGIFHLSLREADDIVLSPLTGFAKFTALAESLMHSKETSGLFPLGGSLMERLVLLGRGAPVLQIGRPHHRRCLAELADIVEEIATKGGTNNEKGKEERVVRPAASGAAGA